MALITIQFGAKASSAALNNNFRYLAELIQSQIQSLTAVVTNSKASLEAIAASFEASVYKIGDPKISLTNTLQDNEIWLFGAEVLKSDYPNLYAVYGDTYGTPENENNFLLPDFRNRTLWGGEEFGYKTAALPNITGQVTAGYSLSWCSSIRSSGVFVNLPSGGYHADCGLSGSGSAGFSFDASRSSAVYKNDTDTVQPPSVIVRVKTRYA